MRTREQRNARDRERRAEQRKPRPCAVCRTMFTPARDDGRYCTVACRMRAYRARESGQPVTAIAPRRSTAWALELRETAHDDARRKKRWQPPQVRTAQYRELLNLVELELAKHVTANAARMLAVVVKRRKANADARTKRNWSADMTSTVEQAAILDWLETELAARPSNN